MTQVKICGIKDPSNLQAAISAGARFIGLVFYAPSPRYVSLDIASNLARAVPTGVRTVGLFVNPTNDELSQITGGLPLDMIQLHGQESPARIAEIKSMLGMPVMKAVNVAEPKDLDGIKALEKAADWLLFDAKPVTSDLPGGTGETFDWSILAGRTFSKPWMLSGGLTVGNVGKALSALKPDAVDVSSGVERERGVKDPQKIKQFIEAVKSHG